jgi:hypothetical protein
MHVYMVFLLWQALAPSMVVLCQLQSCTRQQLFWSVATQFNTKTRVLIITLLMRRLACCFHWSQQVAALLVAARGLKVTSRCRPRCDLQCALQQPRHPLQQPRHR